MTPPDENANFRGRRRSYHACLTCRRKKTRCPGEKPACSSCVRLNQRCSYPPAVRAPQNGRSEERLAHLEEKLDRLLSGGIAAQTSNQDQISQDTTNRSDKSSSLTPPAPYTETSDVQVLNQLFSGTDSSLRPGLPDIAVGMGLYFQYCHRQPIWCFEREEVGDYANVTEELACSVLALTARYSPKREELQLYDHYARHLIMLRIANGKVDLATIESLCLLSYSSFIDGNTQLGQFHLGLAFQLCRSALLDLETAYEANRNAAQRKKRLFWSLQVLEQYYGRQIGLLCIPAEAWRPPSPATGRGGHKCLSDYDQKGPPLPKDDIAYLKSPKSDQGIWNTSVHLGWVWSRVRKYVADCADNIFIEPWRRDSMYATVLSDFMETENRIPMCHRYDSAKFYERKVEELKGNRDYWATWLKEQFTYHAIHTVLNHPLIYIVGAQHNPNLAIPNTFWRRSSELALLHSTWIVRMIDMVVDKQIPLTDPFFGHIAAIAATVHLYYCCAAATKLKHKSNADFAKCRRFLKGFLPFSAACKALDRNLDKMTRIAAGSDTVDVEDWMPSRIYLSVPLLWNILQFDCASDPEKPEASGLLDASLVSGVPQADATESSLLEIIVATSPEIIINTADGGQEAPTLSYKKNAGLSNVGTPRSPAGVDLSTEQTDSIAFNTTPWLYEDPSEFLNMGDMECDDMPPGFENGSTSSAIWERDFGNTIFNNF